MQYKCLFSKFGLKSCIIFITNLLHKYQISLQELFTVLLLLKDKCHLSMHIYMSWVSWLLFHCFICMQIRINTSFGLVLKQSQEFFIQQANYYTVRYIFQVSIVGSRSFVTLFHLHVGGRIRSCHARIVGSRRTLTLLISVTLRTRRALTLLYKVYGDSTLLVLYRISFSSINALLVLTWYNPD